MLVSMLPAAVPHFEAGAGQVAAAAAALLRGSELAAGDAFTFLETSDWVAQQSASRRRKGRKNRRDQMEKIVWSWRHFIFDQQIHCGQLQPTGTCLDCRTEPRIKIYSLVEASASLKWAATSSNGTVFSCFFAYYTPCWEFLAAASRRRGQR